MTTEQNPDKKITNPRIPLLLRIVSIVILVEAFIGLFFFILVGIFQLKDAEFIGNAGLQGISSNFYSFYIILYIAFFLGLVLSGLFLLKQRIIGFYLFISNYLVLTLLNTYMNNTLAWATIITGLCFLAVLLYFKKRMT